MPVEVSEDLIRAVTTKEKALSDGRTLSKKGAFKNVFRTADGTLIWGQCQGSGAKPYELSVDLGGDAPTLRCSCPVKPPPCKHTLGFLVRFLEQAAKFQAKEPPADLAEKRAKSAVRAEKRAETGGKPKEANVAAQKKKSEAQRKAIDDLLEPLLLDSVKNLAKKLRSLGVPCFGCTPTLLPDLLSGAIRGANLEQLAARLVPAT